MPRRAAEREPLIAQGRTVRKQRAILDAARQVFLENGYPGASMDEVAAVANVSKVTVYKHFLDKQSLFTAVFTRAIEDADENTRLLVDRLGASEDIQADLRRFARQHIRDVTQPHLIQMRRMIIAEAHRFPELARSWHRAGPERAHATLARQLEQLADRGVLRMADPLLAAQQLNYLILSVPVNEAMFTGRDRPYSRRQLERFADEGARVFLAAYGTA